MAIVIITCNYFPYGPTGLLARGDLMMMNHHLRARYRFSNAIYLI